MGELAAAGVNSFKFFLAYKGAFAVTDAQLLKGLARCKELGALPMVTNPLFLIWISPTLVVFMWQLNCQARC